MESIDDPLTDSQNPATNTTTTITTAPPIPRSRKGRKQHKQLQSTKGLVEAVRSRNTARDGKTRE